MENDTYQPQAQQQTTDFNYYYNFQNQFYQQFPHFVPNYEPLNLSGNLSGRYSNESISTNSSLLSTSSSCLASPTSNYSLNSSPVLNQNSVKPLQSPNDSGKESLNESDSKIASTSTGSSRSKRRTRTQFSKQQIDCLEATFNKSHYPEVHVVDRLADKLGLSIERISVWFQNRRAKFKKTKNPKSSSSSSSSTTSLTDDLEISNNSNNNNISTNQSPSQYNHIYPTLPATNFTNTNYNNYPNNFYNIPSSFQSSSNNTQQMISYSCIPTQQNTDNNWTNNSYNNIL